MDSLASASAAGVNGLVFLRLQPMDHREIVLASAGYGAMGALLAVLKRASEDLFMTFTAESAVDPGPYQRTVEAVR